MLLVGNQSRSERRKQNLRMSYHTKGVERGTDDRAKQTGTEESGKFHFIPYLQDIDRDTGRDYAQ